MNPSMWTSYLVESSPADMAKTMGAHGWSTCELSDEHGHDLLKMGAPDKVGTEFRKVAAECGMSFPQGHFYLCTKGIRPDDLEGRKVADIAPADDAEFEQAMDDMKRWVDLFNALGVNAGVLHVGGQKLAAAGWEPERILARRLEAVGRVADHARGGVTRICLENLGHAMTFATFEQMAEVVQGVNADNVGYCLDTGHAHLSKVDNPDFIRQAGDRLWALHIADNLGAGDDHMLPYGRGTVPWTQVMIALREIGYTGLFNFEVPGENRCPIDVRIAKLDYARLLAKHMIEEDGV